MFIQILAAVDSAKDRQMIQYALRDYDVLTACDGVEAMRLLWENEKIILLILDVHAPGINGLEVLEALKREQRLDRLRIILLTEHDKPENEIKGLQLGAVDYIRKPLYSQSLKARIDVHVELLRAQQALEQQMDEQVLAFDMFFAQSPIGIAISHNCEPGNPDEAAARMNPVYERITGRTKQELIRTGWAQITHPDDLEEELEYYRKLQAGEISIYTMDKRFIKPDGSISWVHMIVAPLALSNGREPNYICLVQDIAERKEMEKALNESERSKSVLLSQLPGLAYRCYYDRKWTMQYVSQGCLNLTGYSPESLLNNKVLSYNDIIAPEYREALWNKWTEMLPRKQQFTSEYEIITATGQRKWVLEFGQGIYNERDEVEALEGIVIDISDRKAVENALKYHNEHDRWTGLYNRDYLGSLLEQDVKEKSNAPKALIGINLNTVQALTANYGFQYTQNLIKKAAGLLSEHATEKRMLFSTGQDHFIFYVLDYTSKDELIAFSQTVAHTMESLFLMERIGGGIGIVELGSQEELDFDLLLRRLLIASERAISDEKAFGICFYDEWLEALVNRERAIVDALSAIAAEEDTLDDLFLQYQPIIDVKTGSLSDFEALVRLKTEALGQVWPSEFIPIAEKTKLILPIGEKVIAAVLRFLKKLKEQGYEEIRVSINISVIQLLNPQLARRLLELLRETRVDPKNVGIEITESVFAHDYETINRLIGHLRDAGMHVAIDDFGTGYSSLAREKELNVDCIKLDKYFIHDLLTTDWDHTITSDIISMCHKLGHCVVAEGVEQDIQLRYLKAFHCDKIQGHLIGRPLDEEEALRFLKSNMYDFRFDDCLRVHQG